MKRERERVEEFLSSNTHEWLLTNNPLYERLHKMQYDNRIEAQSSIAKPSQPQVREEIGALTASIDDLTQTTYRLLDRLIDVASQSPPECGSDSIIQNSLCPMASTLFDQRMRLQELTKQLASAINRLEI